MKISSPFLLTLVTGVKSAQAVLLEQYTPDRADWTTFYSKAVDNNAKNTDHSPDGVFWIDRGDWEPWDGTIYDPTKYSREDFASKICVGNTLRGMYELFETTDPFADKANPTKAEVDNWHAIAVNHVRAMVNYTEEQYQIEPDKCLHLRALWSDERAYTRKWDTAQYPGTCEGSTNPHCGAGFMPSVADQQEYLPNGITSCPKKSGSEGLFNAAKSNIPWSIKWIRPFCQTLGAEGFWGGHTSPWFHRSQFGWSWWDMDPSNDNSNAGLRTKWSGPSAASKYEDPGTTSGKYTVIVEDVNPNPRFPGYECEGVGSWGGAENATDCYYRVMDDIGCGKRFMTYTENNGCACYPPDMTTCDNPRSGGGRRTWDFQPISSSFDGLFIDIGKQLTGQSLPYNGRRCPQINWKREAKAADASHCFQKIMENDFEDCGRKFITFNANGGGCACYPPDQETCNRSETVGESGRQTYELEVDPAYVAPTAPPTDAPTSETPKPTAPPTDAPTSETPKPTAPPTDAPTSEPSKSPIMQPSTSPSNQPSTSPTTATDVACFENSKDRYFQSTKAGVEKTPKCFQLAKQSEKQQQKNCKRTKSSISGTKPAKDVCPITCGTCPNGSCEEFVSDKFFLKQKKSGKIVYSICSRLQDIRKSDPTKADKICNKVAPSVSIKHPPAGVRCPVTCGTCSTTSTSSTISTSGTSGTTTSTSGTSSTSGTTTSTRGMSSTSGTTTSTSGMSSTSGTTTGTRGTKSTTTGTSGTSGTSSTTTSTSGTSGTTTSTSGMSSTSGTTTSTRGTSDTTTSTRGTRGTSGTTTSTRGTKSTTTGMSGTSGTSSTTTNTRGTRGTSSTSGTNGTSGTSGTTTSTSRTSRTSGTSSTTTSSGTSGTSGTSTSSTSTPEQLF